MTMTAIDRQRLEELAGVRSPRVASRAAVRKLDLASLVSMAQMTATTAAGATPTAAEFDALVADVQELYDAIAVIRAKVKV